MAQPSFSHSGAPAQSKQVRKAPRKPLNLRIADSGPDSAIIMDISVGGALLRTSRPLAVGDAVTINLPHGSTTEAYVTWSNGPLAGCQFATPISEARVSAALLKADPVPADVDQPMPLPQTDALYVDAPDERRMALGVPVIVGSSLFLWSLIAAFFLL